METVADRVVDLEVEGQEVGEGLGGHQPCLYQVKMMPEETSPEFQNGDLIGPAKGQILLKKNISDGQMYLLYRVMTPNPGQAPPLLSSNST